ncbi:MAG: DUF4440 domain-containing protein, partial [Gemmatimonadales bacterium]|nr:DUF4440 domain-containing protein [Gemmatimonadales bacterium]
MAELLAADRAFSAASERSDPAPGLMPMFTDDAVTAARGGRWAEGPAAVVGVLTAGSDFSGGHLRWTPVRGGISADGQQGFTLGYLALRRTDGTDAPFRYLAYWMKSRGGWKVVAYRRVRAAAGDVSVEPMPASVPGRMARPSYDSLAIRTFRASLDST